VLKPEVSILVPNFRTLELTRLCLQQLQQHTDAQRARIVVIDNDSGDASLEWLRTVEGIELIERKSEPGDLGWVGHARALDLAFERVDTPYVLSLHTDSIVRRSDWLDYLLAPFQRDSQVVGVGSWKLEENPWYREIGRRATALYRPLLGKQHDREGEGRRRRFLRSHCAMYRTDVLRQYGLGFSSGGQTAGRAMHIALEEKGYRLEFLPAKELLEYMLHLNHATLVLNPELGGSPRTFRRGQRRMARRLRRLGLSLPPPRS
jgi:GT2 family glycosyltransferase